MKGDFTIPMNRRQFFALLGTIGTTAAARTAAGQTRLASGAIADDAMGVLVDIPNCIGCRKCEYTCQKAAGFDVPSIEAFDDLSVFAEQRRPFAEIYLRPGDRTLGAQELLIRGKNGG